MKKKFDELLELMSKPLRENGGIKTDNSILLVYAPEEELDFRDYLLDTFVPLIRAKGLPLELLDLTGFLFETTDEQTLADLEQDEFDDYSWLKQGLSKRVYIDGVSVGASDYDGELDIGSSPPLFLGSGNPRVPEGVNSNITNFQLYARALGADEVAALFVQPPLPKLGQQRGRFSGPSEILAGQPGAGNV